MEVMFKNQLISKTNQLPSRHGDVVAISVPPCIVIEICMAETCSNLDTNWGMNVLRISFAEHKHMKTNTDEKPHLYYKFPSLNTHISATDEAAGPDSSSTSKQDRLRKYIEKVEKLEDIVC